MQMITRNDPHKHIMLSSFLSRVGALQNSVEKRTTICGTIYSVDIPGDSDIVLVDDPIAFWCARILFKIPFSRLRIWAFELYEFQLPNNNFRNIVRNVFFGVITWLSFVFSGSVLFPSVGRAEFCIRRYPFAKLQKKYRILPNVPVFSTPASNLPASVQLALTDLQARGKIIVIYSGSIQTGRELSPIIAEFEQQDKYHLVLIGTLKGEYENFADRKFKSTSYLGNFDHSIVFRIYQEVSFGILCYSNTSRNTEICAPVKIWEYLHVGIKIIGNQNPALMGEWRGYIDAIYAPHAVVAALESTEGTPISAPAIPPFNVDFISEKWSSV